MVREKTDVIETVELVLEEEELLETPYSVILHNDNVTPIPLVIYVLEEAFELDLRTIINKINEAERTGKSRVKSGCTFSEANQKVDNANKICKKEGFELKFTIEEE